MLTPAKAARRADGGIGIGRERQVGLHRRSRRRGARWRPRYPAGSPNRRSSPETSSVTVSGAVCSTSGGELEGQRGQIALAVKTGEHVLAPFGGCGAHSAMPRSRRPACSAPDQPARSRRHSSCERGAGFGVRLPRHRHQHGRGILHRAAQAEPGGERNAPRGFGRRIAQVHGHQAETAALDQQVGRFQRVLGVVRATNPKQPVEPHPGRGRRSGIEGVFGIHQRAEFLPRRGLGQDARAAGWCGRKRPARRSP